MITNPLLIENESRYDVILQIKHPPPPLNSPFHFLKQARQAAITRAAGMINRYKVHQNITER